MHTKLIRLLVVSVAMLGLLDATAGTAQARITPTGTISGTDTRAEFRSAGVTSRCPRADFTGTIAADGRSISARLAFGPSGPVTCTETLFGSSLRITCTGFITFRESSSSTGTQSATYDVRLDETFTCTDTSLAPRRDISGEQTARGCAILTAITTRLTVTCIFNDSTGGVSSTLTASYTLDRDLTIS